MSINRAKHEHSLLTIKLKEKDQEVKLYDLKMNELKKHATLLPKRLIGERFSVDYV